MSGSPNLSGFTARLVLVLFIGGIALAAWVVRDAFLLMFAATLLAIAVHGIADALTRAAPLPRQGALAAAALLMTGSVAAILWIFGAQLASELSGVTDRLPGAWQRAKETLEAHPAGSALVAEIEAVAAGDSGGSLRGMLTDAGGYALPFASGLTSALLVIFIAAFLTTSAVSTRNGVLLVLPKGVDEKVGKALNASGRALKRWLLGISIDMVIITAVMALTLWLLGVPAFLGLALIAGLAQFVPTVGPLLAAVPGVLLAFTVSPMTALWTAIAYFTVSQLEANLVYPLIQKETTSISPALNLFAILAFGMLLGPLGVLLATPILVVLSVFVIQLYVQDTLGKEADIPGA
ncbi:putative membrane protein [Hyphomonas neptunium ATCC 15444]|uniref:AI-2E family transporter n=2 Tax=Hyphomonas TaxID=85 RepID=A0A059FZ24_9PROT|nr:MULTISPECIES: AI-2E family transporter [Hyphomonas]ABI77088.1 putative membrane protein [Hyphomonas neptunium ATCC 15444]KCZ95969.1 hypothetical protein HHI_04322 [Hyphomonas hirschiana VP5]